MIFGYSTNAYVKYSVKESLERIAALGFNGVEILSLIHISEPTRPRLVSRMPSSA